MGYGQQGWLLREHWELESPRKERDSPLPCQETGLLQIRGWESREELLPYRAGRVKREAAGLMDEEQRRGALPQHCAGPRPGT